MQAPILSLGARESIVPELELPTPLVFLSAPLLALGLAANLLVCILVSYALCVAQAACPVLVPWISEAWVHAPQCFYSRVALSVSAVGLAPLLLVDYVAFTYAHPKRLLLGRVLFSLTMLTVVSLGVAGAVCASATVPSCEGNSAVHDAAATYLFTCLTAYAAASGIQHLRADLGVDVGTAVVMVLLSVALLSGCAALRLSPEVHAWQSSLAALQWCDALFIMGWMVLHTCRENSTFEVGFLRQQGGPAADSDVSASTSVPATASVSASAPAAPPFLPSTAGALGRRRVDAAAVKLSLSYPQLTNIVIVMSVSTLIVTFALSTLDGSIHPLKSWPMISDLWTTPPTNMISRYFVCLGATLTSVMQVGHYCVTYGLRSQRRRLNQVLHVLSVVGATGLCIVGSCNEDEYFPLHQAGSHLFFGCFGVYLLLDFTWSIHEWSPSFIAAGAACCVCSAPKVLQVLLGDAIVRSGDGVNGELGPRPAWHAPVEWAMYLSFMLYLHLSTSAYKDASLVVLSIWQRTPTCDHKA